MQGKRRNKVCWEKKVQNSDLPGLVRSKFNARTTSAPYKNVPNAAPRKWDFPRKKSILCFLFVHKFSLLLPSYVDTATTNNKMLWWLTGCARLQCWSLQITAGFYNGKLTEQLRHCQGKIHDPEWSTAVWCYMRDSNYAGRWSRKLTIVYIPSGKTEGMSDYGKRGTCDEDWLRKSFMRLCGIRSSIVYVLLNNSNNNNNNIMREWACWQEMPGGKRWKRGTGSLQSSQAPWASEQTTIVRL